MSRRTQTFIKCKCSNLPRMQAKTQKMLCTINARFPPKTK